MFLVLALAIGAGIVYMSLNNPVDLDSISSPTTINVTEQTFPAYLSFTSLVQDLPEGAEISFKTTDQEYVVKRGSARIGKATNPDMTITVPSKYIPEINSGFCQALTKARANGDLNTEVHLSESALAWKYKSLYGYKACLGF